MMPARTRPRHIGMRGARPALVSSAIAISLGSGSGAAAASEPAARGFAAYGAGGYLEQLVGGLGFVVVAIFALAWLMRRFSGTSGAGIPRAIEILAVRSVGARERLMLVRVGEEQVLIGITPTGMRTLHRLEKPLDLPATAHSPAAPVSASRDKAGVDFASVLRKQFSKTQGACSTSDPPSLRPP